jgi:capsular polysaccharide biosynthesis protein
MLLALGAVAALAASMMMALALHRLNPYFRTPDEVQDFLGVPVLATLPAGND